MEMSLVNISFTRHGTGTPILIWPDGRDTSHDLFVYGRIAGLDIRFPYALDEGPEVEVLHHRDLAHHLALEKLDETSAHFGPVLKCANVIEHR